MHFSTIPKLHFHYSRASFPSLHPSNALAMFSQSPNSKDSFDPPLQTSTQRLQRFFDIKLPFWSKTRVQNRHACRHWEPLQCRFLKIRHCPTMMASSKRLKSRRVRYFRRRIKNGKRRLWLFLLTRISFIIFAISSWIITSVEFEPRLPRNECFLSAAQSRLWLNGI